MAAVGALMDDSYADRAKKATIASNLRNNAKQLHSQPILEAPGAISSSTSDTLDSSPALSTSQTPATSLVMPNSVPMSSASSDQASPARPAPSLPPANVRSQQSPWKTPTKQPPASNLATAITNFDKHQPPSELSPPSLRSGPHPSSLKAASRPSQRNVDPFVVNYGLNDPSLTDASNWPQVGESNPPQHRARPSASSTSSTIIISTPQPPIKPAYDTESDLSPSKKAKGEKTKWVPIPPKELQAAVDEVTRQRHGGSNPKSQSPRVNGRGRRLNEDTSDSKQGSKPVSRGESRSSPVRAANTRHDRKPSLTVPSAGSSRRVSPLHMTSSLPSPSSNLILENTPDSPSHQRLPSPTVAPAIPQTQTIPENQALQNDRSEASVPSQAPFYSTPSRNSSQTAHPTAPVMAYPPMWASPMYTMPYYPPYQNYQAPVTSQNHPPKETATEIQYSSRIRQKRKRRPIPSEAPAVSGYRTTVPEVLHEIPGIGVEFGNNASIEVDGLVSKAERPVFGPPTRIRTPWWSLGVSDQQIERWLRRNPDLLVPKVQAETLCKDSGVIFGITSPMAAAESPVENAILQNNQFGSQQEHLSDPTTDYPTWPAPGAGPSSLDIGIAMGIPILHPHPMPTPLYMGMPPPPPASHFPSPASAVSRSDWSGRDEPFTPMLPQAPMHPYAPYQSMNGHPGPNYGTDAPAVRNAYGSEGRGGRGWRDDRYTPRGSGRGRGYPSRGRGFRGAYGGPRSSNSQYVSPGGIPQSPYPPPSPSQPPSNTTTVYIPDPVLHQPMYPYNHIIPPQPFTGYRPSGPTAQEPSVTAQGRPPSPKPMTPLTMPLEPTRFKLLGQIEYYFSHENVAKDMYLREKMDSKGWVSLQILQSFPRIQNLKVSDELIHETLRWSQYVEVRQNHVRMARNEWRHYVKSDAIESTVSDTPDPVWYPPPMFYPGYPGAGMPPMYPPPNPYAYYHPSPQANPYAFSNGIADHILRRPEERMSNGNGILESGTSVGESFDSTPHTTEEEDAETSEDDIQFLIGDPSPMTRPTNTQTTGEQVVKKMTL